MPNSFDPPEAPHHPVVPCPRCGAPSELVARDPYEPVVLRSCPDCYYEWRTASASAALTALKSELQVERHFDFLRRKEPS